MTQFTKAVLILLFCFYLTANAQTTAPAPPTTTIARDLSFRALDGTSQIRMSDYENQTVVIVLWASWCPPCRLALTELTTMKRDTFSKTPFPILALSIEDPATAQADLKQAVEIINFKETVGWIDERAPLVGGHKSVPQILIVKNLKVLKRFISWHPRNIKEIRTQLTTALKPSR